MKATPGPLFTQVTGKVGGVVAARNRAGQYTRAYVIPVDTITTAKTNSQARLGSANTAWLSLSDALRIGWASYAATLARTTKPGFSYALTGRNCFIAQYCFRSQCGAIVPTTPPSLPGRASICSAVTAGMELFTTTLRINTLPPDYDRFTLQDVLGVWISASSFPPTVNHWYRNWVFVQGFIGNDMTPPDLPFDITLPFTILSGDRLAIRFRHSDNLGRIGSPTTTILTCA